MANNTGLRSGHIEIIKELGGGKVLIRCDCGQEKEVYKSNIMRGNQHSCGDRDCPYHKTERKVGSISNGITGKRFGQLTVLKELGYGRVLVQCDCGKKLEVSRCSLLEDLTKSCGCNRSKVDPANYLTPSMVHFNQFDTVSENELVNYIISILTPDEPIKRNIKLLSNVCSIDIYIPNKRIGIDFDTVYNNCSLNKDKKYHQNKSLACMKQGIRLIHIYEYEWKNPEYRDKIKQYLNNILVENKQVLYARKLELVELSKDDEKAFFDANHLQGYSSSNMCYGLCTDGEVISAMSFGKPRFKQNAEWEIIRYCNVPNIMVVGGAERLFSKFINSTVPESIQTYASLDKFFGDVYLRLGFEMCSNATEPGYVWVEDNTFKVLSRYQTMKKDLIQKGLGTDEQTEDEIMYNLGYYKVYNSGNLNYVWEAVK